MIGRDIFAELQREDSHFDWAVAPDYPSVGGSLRMKKHQFPWSIKDAEFDFIYSTIVENDLKCGYEVATAFGISSLAAGLAFKKTGGKLVTMDAYIEEHTGFTKYEMGGYTPENKPDGLQVTEYLIEKYGLQNIVNPEIGWSPQDTHTVLSKHFDLNIEKLDYIFVDAAHWDEAAINDIDSVVPFLKERCHIFFHDIHCFGPKFFDHVRSVLGGRFEVVVPAPLGFNLSKVVSA